MAKTSYNPKPPKVLDEKQIEQLEALSSFLTIAQISDYFMIAQKTFQRILERQPEAMAKYKKGKSNAILSVANSLLTKANNGDTTAQIFFLKTQAGWSERGGEPDNATPPPAKVIIKTYDGRKPSDN